MENYYEYKEYDIVKYLSIQDTYHGMYVQSTGNNVYIYKIINIDNINNELEIKSMYVSKLKNDGGFKLEKLKFFEQISYTLTPPQTLTPRRIVETKLTDELNINKVRSKKLKELLK